MPAQTTKLTTAISGWVARRLHHVQMMHGQAEAMVRVRARHFIMVEVMVASMILALIFGGVFVLVNQSLYAVRSSMDHYLAVNLAQNRLEKMTTVPVMDLWDFAEEDVVVDHDGSPDLNGYFKRTVSLRSHTSDVVEAVVRIDIRNRTSGLFEGQKEVLSMLITDIPEKT